MVNPFEGSTAYGVSDGLPNDVERLQTFVTIKKDPAAGHGVPPEFVSDPVRVMVAQQLAQEPDPHKRARLLTGFGDGVSGSGQDHDGKPLGLLRYYGVNRHVTGELNSAVLVLGVLSAQAGEYSRLSAEYTQHCESLGVAIQYIRAAFPELARRADTLAGTNTTGPEFVKQFLVAMFGSTESGLGWRQRLVLWALGVK